MNFLAHCHLAHVTQTSMLGNLLGDFAKGPVSSLPYSDEVKLGIELHRAVDSYTDNHEYTLELKAQLGKWRRFGGIILDVFYDHQLACQFERIENMPLLKFSTLCYQQLADVPDVAPERFKRVVTSMSQMDWLSGYKKLENIERALVGISQRLSNRIELSHSIDWYLAHQPLFSNGFLDFYNELQNFSKEYVENRTSKLDFL